MPTMQSPSDHTNMAFASHNQQRPSATESATSVSREPINLTDLAPHLNLSDADKLSFLQSFFSTQMKQKPNFKP